MRNLGVIELGTTYIKIEFGSISENETYVVTDKEQTEIQIATDIANGEMIKQENINYVVSLLKNLKAKCSANGVSEIYCVASDEYLSAKNQRSFFDEVYSQTGFRFNILTSEEMTMHLYSSFINTLDCPKGLIVSVDGINTKIFAYNRRNLLASELVDLGGINLAELYADKQGDKNIVEQMTKTFAQKIKDFSKFEGLDAETQIVGTGEAFLALARLSRKVKHYQYSRDHAYQMTEQDFDKVYEFVKTLEFDKTKRMKGISNQRADVLMADIAIIKAIIGASKISKIIVAETGISDAILLNNANPLTLEKPISDVLGYSLDCQNTYFNNLAIQNTSNVYNMSMIVYRQLKVLHKLPRNYVKVLRIASYFYNSGKRISAINSFKKGFDIVMNSDIYGVAHHEQILASFVVACQYLDDFSMTDWVRYNAIFNETDLEAVRKLAVIVRLASKLDAYGAGRVKDISCDILGDSVIMKTLVEQPADLEIREAMTVAKDFAKAFKKHLEVL